MDFTDSNEEAEFRSKVRHWLELNAPETVKASQGLEGNALKTHAQAWQAAKAAAGFACISWPEQWGGPGGTLIEQMIFEEEEAKYGLGFPFFGIGLGMCVPTIMAIGSEATKAKFVGPALRGEQIWCQLFSEPGAGSDVAASRTRATQAEAGGAWIVNGQKVWTSGAHYSDFGLLLARTNPDVPKHKGLTMFWLDMRSPGVDIRPIHQASGESEFNEVYFADVSIPDDQRLGEVGKGWNVALITLMNERLSIGGGFGPNWPEAMQLLHNVPGVGNESSALAAGGIRERIADWYVAAEGLKHTRARTLTSLSRGQVPGPEASIGKIVWARQMQELATEVLDRLDQHGVLEDHQIQNSAAMFQQSFFMGAAMRIAGGTDEILRNIIAERVLGLPSDLRSDRDVPFKDIPSGP